MFFPGAGGTTTAALEYCNKCIVSIECVEYASGRAITFLGEGASARTQKPVIQKHGIWGGESWKARQHRIGKENRDLKSQSINSQKRKALEAVFTLKVFETHCKNGHEYVEGTVEISAQPRSGRSYRKCLICNDKTKKKINERIAKKKINKRIELETRIIELEKQLRDNERVVS